MALPLGKVEPDAYDPSFNVSFCFSTFRYLYQRTPNCTCIGAIRYLLQIPPSLERPVKTMSRKFATTGISCKLSCYEMKIEIRRPWGFQCLAVSFSDVEVTFIADLSTIPWKSNKMPTRMCALLQPETCSPETAGKMTTLARNLTLARTEPAAQKRLAIANMALKLVGLMVNHRMISVGATATRMQNVAASRRSLIRNALSMCVAASLASAARPRSSIRKGKDMLVSRSLHFLHLLQHSNPEMKLSDPSPDKDDGCQSGFEQPDSGASGGDVQSRIIGYYESWAHDSECHGMPFDKIPVDGLTHLYFSFGYISPHDFKILPMDNQQDSLFSDLTDFKKKKSCFENHGRSWGLDFQW